MAHPGNFTAQAFEAHGTLRNHAERELAQLRSVVRERDTGWRPDELLTAARLATFLDDQEAMTHLMFTLNVTPSFKGFDGMPATSASEVAAWIEAFHVLSSSNEEVVTALAAAQEERRRNRD